MRLRAVRHKDRDNPSTLIFSADNDTEREILNRAYLFVLQELTQIAKVDMEPHGNQQKKKSSRKAKSS